eukprot:TRINITY_DN68107_c12_g10_i1.p1 TRINITY_DN68107_c12_g10~~TRINITY_DN68107_c12_g10_i1.p1  ORF type:complete len:182 (+),score=30.26 TRINITY_DN68107_c12_g10_i1:40-585(+)
MLKQCAFETERLLVKEWHSFSASEVTFSERDEALAVCIAHMLTAEVTQSLPPGWQGAYSVERAKTWISERDAESPTLLVVDKVAKTPVGLMILFPDDSLGSGVTVRLGYLLDKGQWGKGFASELVKGFVGWCKTEPRIGLLEGGVAKGNVASSKVLEKNGFSPAAGQPSEEETMYQLQLKN